MPEIKPEDPRHRAEMTMRRPGEAEAVGGATDRACIERKALGVSECLTFEQWAERTIQDDGEAIRIAHTMLEGELPYRYNTPESGAEPEFYEEFDVTDADALQTQLQASERELTEVTYEVTLGHFAEGSPHPDESTDVAAGLGAALIGRGFDVQSVVAKRR